MGGHILYSGPLVPAQACLAGLYCRGMFLLTVPKPREQRENRAYCSAKINKQTKGINSLIRSSLSNCGKTVRYLKKQYDV